MWEKTNLALSNGNHKKISFGSFKRYLSELKNMSGDEIKELQNDIEYIQSERNKELLDALESSEENSKKVKLCKKRLNQVNIKLK